MPYFIEFGQDPCEAFYQKIELVDYDTGEAPAASDGVDHQLSIAIKGNDYGSCIEWWQLVASETNGLITRPEPNVLVIDIPPSRFAQFRCRPTVKFKLRAVPADPDEATVLANGTITFGAF